MILPPPLDWSRLQNVGNKCFIAQASPTGVAVDTLVIEVKSPAVSPRWRMWLRSIEVFATVTTVFSIDVVAAVPAGNLRANRAIASATDFITVAAGGVASPSYMGIEVWYNSTVAVFPSVSRPYRTVVSAGAFSPLFNREWPLNLSWLRAGSALVVQPESNGIIYNLMWVEMR